MRDKTCRHPGCNRAAVATEIDHTIPWHHGGRTDHDNLACLCAKHHRLKTIGLWDYMQPEPGTITATSPAGKTYTTQPPPF
ncbi:HNH endonuclease signature motif containing protein [Arthrobacter subterraneus]|uniref:HNH endonuclease signature motif containing protein n=1 Tax=Arthrobacter subterraneus TaxID=335973 RepID=UPI000A02DF12|nr:HNH endonuclease signature motif containing protein [Arthrobacter subterraneus]